MIVQGMDKLMSLTAQGSFGFSNGYGRIRFGYTRIGLLQERCGIYQRKKTLKGYMTSKMRFYRPTNPQTSTQQAWRTIFAAGWTVYNLLTTEQKKRLARDGRKQRISGPNLFMSRYLQQYR